MAEFRRIHPEYTPLQVDMAAATAFRAWAGQRMEAERRAANPVSQARTWVYQVNFTGANGRAMHTIDIPLMFDNVAMAEGQIGTAPERVAEANGLAAVMSADAGGVCARRVIRTGMARCRGCRSGRRTICSGGRR